MILFCVEEIQRSFNQLENGFDMAEPTKSSSSGGATVGYSIKSHVLEQVCKPCHDRYGNDVDVYKSRSKIKITQLSELDQNAITARLTLDYHTLYFSICHFTINKRSINHNPIAKPDLTLINEFRADEWANNQKFKISKAKLEHIDMNNIDEIYRKDS